jgi:ATP phosphoribosyltransferase
MTPTSISRTLRLALPKGRIQQGVFKLLDEAGVELASGTRTYRPRVSLEDCEAKILKPHDVVEMLHIGSRDLGFAGVDWVEELGAEVVELLDTGLDPVRIVAAAPGALLVGGELPKRHLVVASEYRRLAERWIRSRSLDATIVKSAGATEVVPPEDADVIVDNSASGATLEANGLVVVDLISHSSTRLFASAKALDDPWKRDSIERIVLLVRSVLDARERVMLELNVSRANLERVVEILPCMREPTIASLFGQSGFAVRAAVPRSELPKLIPALKARGGTDLVVTSPSQIVP